MDKVANENGENVKIPKWIANVFTGIALSLIVGLQLSTGERIRQIEIDMATMKTIYESQHDIIKDLTKKNSENIDEHQNIRSWADEKFVRK